MHSYRGVRPLILVAAAVALVLVIGLQTVTAVQSQRQIVDRVLHDHAETAAWTLEQRLREAFQDVLECGFHYTLHTSRIDDRLPVIPSAAEVRASFATAEECEYLEVPIPAWAVRVVPGSEPDVAGPAPQQALRRAERLLTDGDEAGPPIGRNHYLMAPGGADGTIIAYLRAPVSGEFGYWIVPIEPAVLGGILNRACSSQALLPPTVWPADAAPDLLPVILSPGGSMFGELHDAPVASASRELAPEFGGMKATVHISPVAAEILAPESAEGSPLPLLMLMLAVSLALLGLAFYQLRRDQELSRLRSDFVASVSHELRTPLALQRIFLDTIRLGRAEDPERLSWALDHMDREGLRLERMVSNILHFSRSERGTLELELAPAELGEVVERVVAWFQPLAAAAGSEIVLDSRPVTRAAVDPEAFQQALSNVLDNALKFGPAGQTVTVTVKSEQEEAIVSVVDQGPGVPHDEREVLFARFRRGKAAVGTSVTGSGIGLSVVRDVLRRHNGSARFEDSTSGACVSLVLPLAASESNGTRPTDGVDRHSGHAHAGGR